MSIAAGRSVASPRIGIIGGGQLAQMLADAGARIGRAPRVLAAATSDPVVRAGHDVRIGDPEDPAVLSAFLAEVDVVTFENEFVDVERLRTVLRDHPGVAVRPGLRTIALAQDKLAQKEFLERSGIPTAEFIPVLPLPRGEVDLEEGSLSRRFPDGYVLKWSRFGYDGRGNLHVDDPVPPWSREIVEFCRTGRARGARIYAERAVPFVAELAVIAARGLDGSHVELPVVRTRQESGICREVRGPATAFSIDPSVERRALEIARTIGTHLDYCGVFAVEFFLDASGELLVNEIAPRVHNSGHFSLWSDEVSQFEWHLRAIAGETLRPAPREEIVLMRNLLGPIALEGAVECPPPPLDPPEGTELRWYGKKTVSRGRKMGHLTARAANPAEAEEISARMVAFEERIWDEILGSEERGKEEPWRRKTDRASRS